MAGKEDDLTAEIEDAPDFARETRIVDFGQSVPMGEMMDRLTRGDPLPQGVQIRFRTVNGSGDQRVTEMKKPIVILGRGKFILTDMGSTNGTFVNRKPVREAELKPGDQIRIGITVLAFEVDKAAK